MAASCEYFEARQDEYSQGQIIGAIAFNREVPWTDWIPEYLGRQLNVCRYGTDTRAWVLLARASYRFSLGRFDASLVDALESLAASIAYQRSIKSSVVRMMTSHHGDEARELALAICIESSNFDLAAELIESSRLGILPTSRSADEASEEASAPISALTGATTSGATGISRITPVSVNGKSELGARLDTLDANDPLPLEDIISPVGLLDRGGGACGLTAGGCTGVSGAMALRMLESLGSDRKQRCVAP